MSARSQLHEGDATGIEWRTQTVIEIKYDRIFIEDDESKEVTEWRPHDIQAYLRREAPDPKNELKIKPCQGMGVLHFPNFSHKGVDWSLQKRVDLRTCHQGCEAIDEKFIAAQFVNQFPVDIPDYEADGEAKPCSPEVVL